MRNYWFCFFIWLPFLGFSQLEETRRIVQTLCSEEFHGRGYVNKGDSIAADFLANEFQKLGVEPVRGSYFQRFDIKGVQTFPKEMTMSINGKKLIPGKHFMVAPNSAGISGELNPQVITWREIIEKEKFKKAIESLRENKKNAIVLSLIGAKGDTLKQLKGISKTMAEAFPVIEIVNKKFTWSVGRKPLKNALIYVQDSVFSLEKISANVKAKHIKSYQSQNVIATIPAKKKCAKTIVFTAHYDHLGRMGEHTYFPGANDNASGTAMLFTMARYFKENPSKYNIVFIAFGGEEAGLLGSKFYTENPLFPLKKIKFLANLDIMGSGEDGITVVNATLFEKQFKLLQTINDEKQLLKQVKRRGPAANSDHYWFTEKGVPSFFIYTMGRNNHYHDVFDRYSELSFNEYKDITTLLIEFLKRI